MIAMRIAGFLAMIFGTLASPIVAQEDWGKRGEAFCRAGKYAEALKCFGQMAEGYPDDHMGG